jgi:hypothetical protein
MVFNDANFNRGPDSKKAVKSFPTIVDYARRIHDRFYPDFTLWE